MPSIDRKNTKPRDDHLVVRNVIKRFGDVVVLDDVSMVIRRGQTAVIIGGSGAGKTTLLRILIGLEKPSSGSVFIDGEDIVPLGGLAMNRVRKKFGMVFQYSALLDSLSVMDNVAFPLVEHTRMKKAAIRERVLSTLESLGLQTSDAQKSPAELSGGMRKRVALARALMLEPEILIYDEPTSGLDPITSRMVDDLIEETRERYGITSVVISHDMASTFRIAHQAFLLIRGKVAASGTPEELADINRNKVSHDFIVASGVAFERISRPPLPGD
ncbi:MAG TPA: ATP-binding cassette domain-containing protein [Polyangiaceae bacterium]|jgi:phospholipid/cholesterol/gamma-HCH transport system ATP-binding protein|nr:ATP-binding cassette domain-containing protein [Polyangiaceae bacterium]HNZ24295.1 ATP-binding cassette domain-containing protein [Polyangiaceae bacterium]HOD24245.1 ATP-binding cassette domain-containing protein [Polyangiaceae bacterium]HOE50836.1 ATP-binding cassette domain-containing protein [Polyangiaceae bacterium]HOH02356.1 ATP-binding cassette domain-containing protein [Polyangiaceae bacterium]